MLKPTSLVFYQHALVDTQSIETIPRVFRVHAQPDPLCHNLLAAFEYWTSRMFRESLVHQFRLWVNVTKENA